MPELLLRIGIKLKEAAGIDFKTRLLAV